jgi:hypothetical protein
VLNFPIKVESEKSPANADFAIATGVEDVFRGMTSGKAKISHCASR